MNKYYGANAVREGVPTTTLNITIIKTQFLDPYDIVHQQNDL